MRIFVDCDGVIANFDKLAIEIFGGDPRTFEKDHGSDVFWERIRNHKGFFSKLELMPGAIELMIFLAPWKPWILTGVPSQIPEAHFDKQEWAKEKFGAKQPIITCQSKNKANFCQPGDVIIDDWPKHQSVWEGAGGHWIVHTDVEKTIWMVKELITQGVIPPAYAVHN